MKYFFLIIIILISGCSSQPVSHQIVNAIFGEVFEKATKKDVSYIAAHCPTVKQNCSNGKYQEWYQQNGKKACACNM